MQWPDRIVCHTGDLVQRFHPDGVVKWRPPEPGGRPTTSWTDGKWVEDPKAEGAPGPYGYPFRTCEYCGSINPEDLYVFLTTVPGVRLGGSDWKYGWPHKFYVKDIPNPLAGARVCDGGSYSDGTYTPHFGVGPEFTTARWYNTHLLDVTDEETFAVFTKLLSDRAGILFARSGERLHYTAPYHGFQA